MWPSYCPVCGDELPTRGNRRLRVPGRGLRLVHAGACAEAIEAQLTIDTEPGSPSKLARAALVLQARRWLRYCAQLEPERGQLGDDAIQRHIATLRLMEASGEKHLVREEAVERAHDARDGIAFHLETLRHLRREDCTPPRTEAIFT